MEAVQQGAEQIRQAARHGHGHGRRLLRGAQPELLGQRRQQQQQQQEYTSTSSRVVVALAAVQEEMRGGRQGAPGALLHRPPLRLHARLLARLLATTLRTYPSSAAEPEHLLLLHRRP